MSKKLLAAPYLVWMAGFIIIPLALIVCSSSAYWSGLAFVGQPPRARLLALGAPPARRHHIQWSEISKEGMTVSGTSVAITWEAGYSPG